MPAESRSTNPALGSIKVYYSNKFNGVDINDLFKQEIMNYSNKFNGVDIKSHYHHGGNIKQLKCTVSLSLHDIIIIA